MDEILRVRDPLEKREPEQRLDVYAAREERSVDDLKLKAEGRLLDVLGYPDQHITCEVHECASAGCPGLAWQAIVDAHQAIRSRVVSERSQTEEP